MGSKTVTPVNAVLAGGAITKTDSGGTSATIIIAASTAQSALRMDALMVVFENYSSTASCVVTLNAGDNYSDTILGAASAITLATAGSIVIGGRDLESSRFLDSSGHLEFTITTAGTVYVYALMVPFVQLNPS